MSGTGFEITTPRLRLRPPCLDDTDAVQTAKESMWPDLQRYMSWASDDQAGRDATETFIGSAIAGLAEITDTGAVHELPIFGFDRATGDFVASAGLHATSCDRGPATGYWVPAACQGRGYATEAANALIRFAFGAWGVERVSICHFSGNDASQRVIEKLGFTPTMCVPRAHRSFFNGALLHEHRYVMDDPSVLPPLEVSWSEQSPATLSIGSYT